MDDRSNFLFVYGTLRPSFDNPFARYLRQYSRYVGEGTIAGRLFDIGRYPGVLYEEHSPARIYGTVVELISRQPDVLTYLDEYEGVSDIYESPTEYKREIVPVYIDGNRIECWTYVYNWSVNDCILITSGDYCQYLSQQQGL